MNESKNIFWACFSIIVGLATVIAAVIAILSYFDIRIPWPFWEDPSAGEVVEVGQDNKALDNTDGIMEPSPYCVNLGLSVRWNKRNLGALYPEEYGDYYAWGEIETKSTYSWSNYKWCKGFSEQPLKYGPVDEKYVLDPSDDVAYRRGMWRMPTAKEMEELVTRCHWTWITLNGVKGYNVEGPNGNSIFLPAAGFRSNGVIKCVGEYGRYWANSAHQNLPQAAYFIGFTPEEVELSANERFYGHTIRPVTP